MRKNIIHILLVLFYLTACKQKTKTEFDGKTWLAPYNLPMPQGWEIERFLIPISFAPSISYKGVEDVRFTPGWGIASSEEYWSYCFLWYLEGNHTIDVSIIEANLKAYYTGLIGSNIERLKIPADKLIPTVINIKKIETEKGDLESYSGTINMLDYMEQKPITLNCMIQLKSCSEKNKTFIFHEISPKPFTHKVWQSLNELKINFDCTQNDGKQ
jgi:hypothetical protein